MDASFTDELLFVPFFVVISEMKAIAMDISMRNSCISLSDMLCMKLVFFCYGSGHCENRSQQMECSFI